MSALKPIFGKVFALFSFDPIMVAAATLTLGGVCPSYAAVMSGDHFTVAFTETTPTPGLTASADISLGSPATAGFFHIASFSVISGTGVCLTCGLLTENLSGVLFDATTLGLKGDVTGSFLGQGGGLHRFDLALSDTPATWVFTDVHVTGGFSETFKGTYTTLSAVDEPSPAVLLGIGVAAIAWLRLLRPGRRGLSSPG